MSAFVSPPAMRSRIEERGGQLIVTMPVRRNWFVFIFLSFWMCGWVIGECFGILGVLGFLPESNSPEQPAFLVLWLAGWTVGGLVAGFIWLWMLAGREVLTFSEQRLTRRWEALGFGRTHEFSMADVRNLRVGPAAYNPFDMMNAVRFWGFGGGLISFDYGAKTFCFGGGIDEAEAQMILDRVHQRFRAGSS